MADRKTKTASRKTGSSSRSRSSAKRSTAGEQNAKTAAGNAEATDRQVNQVASEQAARASAESGEGARPAKLHPEVEKHLLGNSDEPLSSINNVPKAEGGMPADVIATIRSNLDQVRGAGGLGQPGQAGHGVGLGTVGMAGSMSDEEIEANEKEYASRVKA